MIMNFFARNFLDSSLLTLQNHKKPVNHKNQAKSQKQTNRQAGCVHKYCEHNQLRIYIRMVNQFSATYAPNLLIGFLLKSTLSKLCASALRNCGIPNLALEN